MQNFQLPTNICHVLLSKATADFPVFRAHVLLSKAMADFPVFRAPTPWVRMQGQLREIIRELNRRAAICLDSNTPLLLNDRCVSKARGRYLHDTYRLRLPHGPKFKGEGILPICML